MAHGDYQRGIKQLEHKRRQQMRERITKVLIITGLTVVGISGIAMVLILWRSGQLFH